MQMDFSGKRVLVAGAETDVGRAIANAFEAQGAAVATYAVPAESDPADAASGISRDAYGEFVRSRVDALGGLDILVNVADIRARGLFDHVSPAAWENGLEGARQAMFCTQHAVPALIASNGAIVNITSTLGRMAGVAGTSVASAAAGAVEQLTQMAALRWGDAGVRVNCVCVGSMVAHGPQSRSIGPDDATPLGRLADTDDIVGPVLFLASPLAGHVTGAILVCDGGAYAGH